MAYSQIKGLTLEIGGDTTKLSKALSSVNKDLRTTQADLNAVNKALKLDPTNVNLLKDKHDLLGKAITDTRSKLETLKEAYRQGLSNPNMGQAEMSALQREIDLTESSLNNLTGEYNNFGQNASQQTEQVVQNTKTLAQTLDETGEKFKDAGEKLQSVGGTLTKTVTAPIVAVGTVATKSAVNFEDSIANINTLLNDTSNIDAYKSAIMSISDATGVDWSTVSDGMYQAISSLGDGGDETVNIFNTMAKSAKAGGAEVADSVSLISAGMKGYNSVNAETAQKISDLAFMTAKLGVTTFPEMAKSMQPLFPLASSLNLSYEDLFATMATGTGVTGNTAEVSTQMKAVLSNLMKPTAEMQALMEKYGYQNGQAMIKAKGLTGVMEILQKETGGQSDKLAKLFSSTEALTLVTALTGSQFDTFKDKLGQMTEASGSTDTAFKKISETTGFELTKSLNELKNLGVQIGTEVLPTLVDVAKQLGESIKKVSDWFSGLDENQRQFIVKAITLTATVGPLISIFGKLSSGIGSIIQLGGRFAGFVSSMSSTTSTVSQTTSTLSTVSQTAQTTGQSLQTAGQGISSFAQNALGLLAIGGAIGLAGVGFKLLADSAVELATAGAGSVGVMVGLIAGVGGLAVVFAKVGQSLTPASAGMLSFGGAVLMIGGGIGLATAGIGYLISNLPTLAESGEGVANALGKIGQGIVTMSTQTVTVLPELLTLAGTLAGLALAIGGVDLATGALGVTATIGAGGVVILAGAMALLAKSVKSIATNATKAADSIKYINDSVSVIETGVNGLKSVVKDGLGAIVDAFSSESTAPVDAWTQSLSSLNTTTTTQMALLRSSVRSTVKSIKKMFSSTSLQFSHSIQVPHFSMDGVFDAKAGTVPKVNVNWYKNGGIFNSPSVIGVGEAGTEAVVPLDKLDSYVNAGSDKMLAVMSSMLRLMERYMPAGQQVVLDTGALVGEITPAIDDELGVRANRKGRQS